MGMRLRRILDCASTREAINSVATAIPKIAANKLADAHETADIKNGSEVLTKKSDLFAIEQMLSETAS